MKVGFFFFCFLLSFSFFCSHTPLKSRIFVDFGVFTFLFCISVTDCLFIDFEEFGQLLLLFHSCSHIYQYGQCLSGDLFDHTIFATKKCLLLRFFAYTPLKLFTLSYLFVFVALIQCTPLFHSSSLQIFVVMRFHCPKISVQQ